MASLRLIVRQGRQTHSDLKELCNTGKIPAVVYGYDTRNTSVKVDEVEFIKAICEVGHSGIIDLGVDSKTIKVMVSDYRFDPFKNQIIHIDSLAISMTEERIVDVLVQLVGETVGAKEGSVVEQPLFDLQVTATPGNIPESIEADVTDLQINDSYSVGDIKVSGDFTIENDPEESVVTVVPPTDEPSEEEIKAVEGESATEEPEVAGEGKEDEEDKGEE